ncbi:hypothetical protein AYO38_01100 [bacterium SCGC AG-212-C10]|nr:hypothetical protein AYO38_01100 [bacterium SCGC AG-212-C10]
MSSKCFAGRFFARISLRDLLLAGVLLMLAAQQAVPRLTALAQEGDSAVAPAAVLGSSFTYQGRLTKDAFNATGPYDFQFLLFDAQTNGAQVSSTITANDLAVTNGLFAIELAFSGTPFTGDERWLEVRMKADGAATYDSLPRQGLTATPYALYAKSIPLAGSGTAATAARSDHGHFGATWSGSVGDGLTVNNTATGATAIKGVSENGTGVTGVSVEPDYAAVYGSNDNGYGVVGDSKNGSLAGVLGRDANGIGVLGQGGVAGVKGEGSANGVVGISATRGFAGVYGVASAASCQSIDLPQLCYGVIGSAENSPNSAGIGVMGVGTSAGIYGRAAGSGWAGSFDGPVFIGGVLKGPQQYLNTQSITPDTNLTRNLGLGNLAWNLVVANAFAQVSDARLKNDILPLAYGLDDVLALRPVSFKIQRRWRRDVTWPHRTGGPRDRTGSRLRRGRR